LVVVVITAQVVTEFFVRPAMQNRAAIEANFFFVHKAKVNNLLSGCKRLQTETVDYKRLITG
jgi:hypothetical protein